MKQPTDMKETIIRVTTGLIEQSGGNIKSVTARTIAEQSGVGLGLINYHFGSKDNLVTICVQRIIHQVIAGFSMEAQYVSDQERLTAWAVHVFDFLFEHPAISRISILGDLQEYCMDSNSVATQKGFQLALASDTPEQVKPLLSFLLTAAMQTAFLSGPAAKELLGYDFTQPLHRHAYIHRIVNTLFRGIEED